MSLIGKFFGGKGGERAPRENAAKPAAGSSSSSTRRPSSSVRLPRPSAASSSVKLPAIRPPEEAAKSDESKRKIRASTKGKEIGAILLKDAKITEEHLDKALEIQRKKGGLLGQILVALGVCSKADIGAALRKQRTITTVVLDKVKFDPEALQTLPRPFCEKNRLIPFEKIGNQICVAMANVLDAQAKNEMKQMTQLQIKSFDASWVEIKAAIEREMGGVEAESAPAPAAAAKKEAAEDIVIELPEDELLPAAPIAEAQAVATPTKPTPGALGIKDTAVIAKPPGTAAAKAAPPPAKSAPAPQPASAGPAAAAPAAPPAISKPASAAAKPAAPTPPPQAAGRPAPATAKPVAPPPPPQQIAAVAAAAAAAALDVIEDLEAYGIEEIAPPPATALPQEIPEIAEEVAFPAAVLPAIPMTGTYFSEVVQWGKADPERRWLAEHLADNVLPVEPALDKVGA